MSEGRIAEQWQRYRRMVVPSDAGTEQLTGTELAFYGGASALFGVILTVLEPGTEATEKDLETMGELQAELDGHCRSLAAKEPAAEVRKLELYDRAPDANLAAWGPEEGGPLTQVHLRLTVEVPRLGTMTNVIRFKSAEGVDRFVEHLQALRKQVWP